MRPRVPRIAQPVRAVFRRRLRAGDVAYFWLSSPAEMCRDLNRRGVMVVRDMINCSTELRRTELRRAYAALCQPDGSGISDDMIAQEGDMARVSGWEAAYKKALAPYKLPFAAYEGANVGGSLESG